MLNHSYFDYSERLEKIKSFNSEPNDSITMEVIYFPTSKPKITIYVQSLDSKKSHNGGVFDMSIYLPENCYEVLSDKEKEMYPGEYSRGRRTWKEVIDMDLLPLSKFIVEAGGRYFTFKSNNV